MLLRTTHTTRTVLFGACTVMERLLQISMEARQAKHGPPITMIVETFMSASLTKVLCTTTKIWRRTLGQILLTQPTALTMTETVTPTTYTAGISTETTAAPSMVRQTITGPTY